MIGILRAFWIGIRAPRCEALWRRHNLLSHEYWHCGARLGHHGRHSWRAPR